jgi:hypothetical protein
LPPGAAKRWQFLGVAVVPVLGISMGIILRDNLFSNYLDSLFSLFILVPLLLVFAVIALITWLTRRRVWKWLQTTLALGCAGILSIFLFIETSSYLDASENKVVRTYVARAVLILDQMKSRSGLYPSTLPLEGV